MVQVGIGVAVRLGGAVSVGVGLAGVGMTCVGELVAVGGATAVALGAVGTVRVAVTVGAAAGCPPPPPPLQAASSTTMLRLRVYAYLRDGVPFLRACNMWKRVI